MIDVARARAAAVDDRVLLDDADAEAGEIVVALRVHARHFRRLAADQRAPACTQPSTMPLMTDSATSTLSLPVA